MVVDVISLAQGILVPLIGFVRPLVNMLPFSESINILLISLGAGYILRGRITPDHLLMTLWLLISGIIFLALIFVK